MRINLIPSAVLLACACAAAAQKPACSLLTQQTASALYGAPVKLAGGAGLSVVGTCFYSGKGNDMVVLMTKVVPPNADPNQIFDLMTRSPQAKPPQPVAGIGDRAVFASADSSLMLVVLLHTTILTLGATHADTPAQRAALLSAGKDVLSRL